MAGAAQRGVVGDPGREPLRMTGRADAGGHDALALRELLSAAGIGVGVLDADLRYRMVNAAMADMNGVGIDAHVGRTLEEVIPRIADQIRPLVQEVLHSGASITREVRGSTPAAPDRERAWRASYHPARVGDAAGVGMVVEEITGMVEAEHLAEMRLSLLDEAEKAAGIGTFVHDLETGRVTLSRGYVTLSGLPEGVTEIGQDEMFARIHPADRVVQVGRIRQMIAEGGRMQARIRTIRPDGEIRWREVFGRLEHRGEDRPPRVLVVAVDVTERQRAEDLINALAERQTALGRASAVIARGDDVAEVLSVITRELRHARVRGSAVVRFDDDLARVEGSRGYIPVSVGDVVDMDPATAFAAVPAHAGIGRVRVRPSLADATGVPEWRDVEMENLTIAPIEVDDRVWGALLVTTEHAPDPLSDFFAADFARLVAAGIATAGARGELRRMNAELEDIEAERTRELQATVAELGAFAYTVSHDLRGPLRAIHSAAELLEDGSVDEEAAPRLLRMVRESAVSMGALIDDLLRLARLGRQPLEPERVDMEAVLDGVLAEMGPVALRRVELVRTPLPAVAGNPTLLHQVIANLVGNAVKFSRDRDVPRVEVGFDPEVDGGAFRVRDNGVGFDPQYADQAFGLFRRLHTDERFEGTGAGLAIVKRVVERHGGAVRADSEPGVGTTMTFTLPLWDEPAAGAGGNSG